MTKQTNWNGKEVLLVEVESGTQDIELFEAGNCLSYKIGVGTSDFDILRSSKFPEGDWQFAFADPLHPTEQEAREWVEWYSEKPSFVGDKSKTFYMDYETGALLIMIATASLRSRIRSEGFEHPERVIPLIKK